MEKKIADVVAEAVRISIWETPPVHDQPSITLIRWSVMETTSGDRHLVGYNLDDREGRASTAIQSFDPKKAQAVTRSGRIYQLVGPPGYDSDGSWVWSLWANARKIQWRDATDEFQKLITEQSLE